MPPSTIIRPLAYIIPARSLRPGMLINGIIGESVSMAPSDWKTWAAVESVIDYGRLLRLQTAGPAVFCFHHTPVVTAVSLATPVGETPHRQ